HSLVTAVPRSQVLRKLAKKPKRSLEGVTKDLRRKLSKKTHVLLGYAPGLCWVYAHLCSENVRVFFGAALGFPGAYPNNIRTKSKAIPAQYRSNTEQDPNNRQLVISSYFGIMSKLFLFLAALK
ncbi:MAG TPA: hypothetical protein VF008_11570, partial [Niastella sp.]